MRPFRRRREPEIHWTIGPVTQRSFDDVAPAPIQTPRRRPATRRTKIKGLLMLLQADQKVALAVSFTDRAGNVLDLDAVGTLTAVSSDDTVLTVTDNGDGTFEAVTVGPIGTATVTVSNDTDVDGVPDYQGSLAFDVVAGGVFAIAIGAGVPVSRFEEAPPAPQPDPEPVPE